LNHPNIVTIYAVGDVGEIAYIAMELVQGRTLRDLLSDPLTSDQAIDYAVQLAEALAAAHDGGIVHRDLKPDNVMVTSEGLLKVLDFGIAKRDAAREVWIRSPDQESAVRAGITEDGLILGTVGYMSPEQALGRPVDYRSDQFSYGAILYELMSARRAFERSTKAETIAAIVGEDPPTLARGHASPTPAVQRVLARCLAKDPAGRYEDTRDLAVELRQIRDDSRRRDGMPRLTRRRVLGLGALAATGAAAAVGVWRLWPQPPAFRKLAVL